MRRGRGFTLVELVVALAISSTLLIGMAAAVMVAARSLPERGGPVVAEASMARTLDALSEELATARSITSIDAHGIEFTVGDRGGDGQPETVTWSWSGTAGDPMLRAMNNEGGRIAGQGLKAATFTAVARQVTEVVTSTGTPSSEARLGQGEYETSGGVTNWLSISGVNEYVQEITPSSVSGADHWDLTGFAVFARAPSSNPGFGLYAEAVEISGDTKLSGAVLARAYVPYSSLSASGAWVSVTVAGQVRLSPSMRVGVRVRSSEPGSSSSAGEVQASVLSLGGDGAWGRFSAGGLFSLVGLNQLRYTVKGRTWSGAADSATVASKVASVRVMLTDEAGYSSSRTVALAWPTEVTP